jgi:hypothetical protein
MKKKSAAYRIGYFSAIVIACAAGGVAVGMILAVGIRLAWAILP